MRCECGGILSFATDGVGHVIYSCPKCWRGYQQLPARPTPSIDLRRRCRDCPTLFVPADYRTRLCDQCRATKRREIVRRASRKWYASLTPEEKQRMYDRQNEWQKCHRLAIAERRLSRAKRQAA